MNHHDGTEATQVFDVAICGGGLAGLTLARQLKLRMPEISVVVIDKLSRPLPEATFKVGESTVEAGAHYLSETLKLTDYFRSRHLRKLGLRFFFGDASGPFQDRPEFGLSEFPGIDSYQIDRGVLENDLRGLNADAGIAMLEGYSVEDIVLSEGEGRHQVVYRGRDGELGKVESRWVIDAMGRRRFLQKKLDLTKTREKKCSAVWFRLEGRIDVSDLVPREEQSWHARVPNNNRYYSTNHLMGQGYWVWIIPLCSKTTSVGIVALEDLHPFDRFSTYESALKWLQKHEPVFAAYVGDRTPLDFLCMRKYTYASRQVFSMQRWACVSEAAMFPDPFYSPGTDVIGFTNSAITEMVRLDKEGKLTPDLVKEYDLFILSLNDWLTLITQVGYPFFGNAVVMAAKLIWDFAVAWSFLGPNMFNGIFLDEEKRTEVRRATKKFFGLTIRIQQLFSDWAARSSDRLTFDFIDYLKIPFLSKLRSRNLRTGKEVQELVEDQVANMETLEELAQVLFLLAVEDVIPECLDQVVSAAWLNAWGVSLKPEKWEADRLFQPKSDPRDLDCMRQQIRSLFRLREVGCGKVEAYVGA